MSNGQLQFVQTLQGQGRKAFDQFALLVLLYTFRVRVDMFCLNKRHFRLQHTCIMSQMQLYLLPWIMFISFLKVSACE